MSDKPGTKIVVVTEMETNEHKQIEVQSHALVGDTRIESPIMLTNNERDAKIAAKNGVDAVIATAVLKGFW